MVKDKRNQGRIVSLFGGYIIGSGGGGRFSQYRGGH